MARWLDVPYENLGCGKAVNCRHTDADTSAMQWIGKSASAMSDAASLSAYRHLQVQAEGQAARRETAAGDIGRMRTANISSLLFSLRLSNLPVKSPAFRRPRPKMESTETKSPSDQGRDERERHTQGVGPAMLVAKYPYLAGDRRVTVSPA